MEAAALVKAMRAQREAWLELRKVPEQKLLVRRPTESQYPKLRDGVPMEMCVSCIVGWEGVTEADLLGAAIGASDPVPFHPDVMNEALQDRTTWAVKVQNKIVEMVNAHFQQKDKAEKN
jgi:hypothetical protein